MAHCVQHPRFWHSLCQYARRLSTTPFDFNPSLRFSQPGLLNPGFTSSFAKGFDLRSKHSPEKILWYLFDKQKVEVERGAHLQATQNLNGTKRVNLLLNPGPQGNSDQGDSWRQESWPRAQTSHHFHVHAMSSRVNATWQRQKGATRQFHSTSFVNAKNEAPMLDNEQPIQEIEDRQGAGKDASLSPLVLYRGKWMRTFRLLVRLKVVQLAGVGALALPIAQYTQEGSLALGTVVAVGLVVSGAGAASTALWYYSSRYIGELALLPPDFEQVRISVLDFWGNRQDLVVKLRDVVPPLQGMSNAELAAAAQHVLLPLDVVGLRQFVLSLRHGRLLHRRILLGLLHGTLDPHKLQNDGVDQSRTSSNVPKG